MPGVAKHGKADINGISSEGKLNLQCATYLFERVNHEVDDPKPISSKLTFNRVAVVGFPNIDYYGEDDGQGGKIFTIKPEENMVNDVQRLISGRKGNNPANEFYSFNEAHSLTNFSNPKSLDTAITDYSVGVVLETYILPNRSANMEAYNYMKQNGETHFYSCKQNGCFSDFAQNQFAYPSNLVVNASGDSVFW